MKYIISFDYILITVTARGEKSPLKFHAKLTLLAQTKLKNDRTEIDVT